MRKLLAFVLFTFLTVACSDIEQFESKPINLGATSKSTQILSVNSIGSTVTVKYNLTTGAKYAVQVYEFAAKEPKKTLPLMAEEEIVTKVYEFTDLPDGMYDLVLTDVAGTSIKKPLIIKR
jgi:hypothetical protein